MTDLEMTRLAAEAMGYTKIERADERAVYCTDRHGEQHTFSPLDNDAQAMALLCWLVRHNDNERLEISNHVFFYQHRGFSFTQLGGFSKRDHLRRATVECVSKMHAAASSPTDPGAHEAQLK